MRVYRTSESLIIDAGGPTFRRVHASIDELFNADVPSAWLQHMSEQASVVARDVIDHEPLLAPVASQEIWGAGVTYVSSRNARIEESKDVSGGDCYARVYRAERPELFFKNLSYRSVGQRAPVHIRVDAHWSVPEPELAIAINARGRPFGYMIANDVSARDVEGENPLYLPQAKTYDASCALGPCILLTDHPLPRATQIVLEVFRNNGTAYRGETTLEQMRRSERELVDYLTRECSFPHGVILMTGTGIVPPNDFSLAVGDRVSITIDSIGTLVNPVEQREIE